MIAIFDIGKTNKKLSILDEQYRFIFETAVQIPEIKDDDGDPCEDLDALMTWIRSGFASVIANSEYNISALNFSSYGASLVGVNGAGLPATHLYNYLKPFPETLKTQFYNDYGGEQKVALETASPILGNLNSGMQLYLLLKSKPEIYADIQYALHLPQFFSFLFTKKFYSDMTSIGCHTHLWDFRKNEYHKWVTREGIEKILAPVIAGNKTFGIEVSGRKIKTGPGLHDSSSALIPYLTCFQNPFLLISTGTWCISLNPFNQHPLTPEELRQDCLSYLTHEGQAVKASRLFAGHWHDVQTKRLASFFNVTADFYKSVSWTPEKFSALDLNEQLEHISNAFINTGKIQFGNTALDQYPDYESAYYDLMKEIICLQVYSTNLILANTGVGQIFVDGGFGSNMLYMHMLALMYPDLKVYAASVLQASSIGAAMILHHQWNPDPVPADIVKLKLYPTQD